VDVVQKSEKTSHLSGSPAVNEAIDGEGRTFKAFKRELRPRYMHIAGYFLLSYVMLMTGGWVGDVLCQGLVDSMWQSAVIIATGLWFAFWLTVITSHFHEAAHYNLCKDRKRNDLLASLLLSPLNGLAIKSYRKSHWEHHRHLGNLRDTEISYRRPVTYRNIAIGLTGAFMLQTVLHYANVYRGKGNVKQPEHGGSSSIHSFLTALCVAAITHLAIVVGLIWADLWQVAVAWALGVVIFSPFLGILRQTLEHRSIQALRIDHSVHEHGAENRMFGCDVFSRLFGAAGFNRHLLHHWDPSVSYTCFDEMERFLMTTPLREELDRSRMSYVQAFRSLLC